MNPSSAILKFDSTCILCNNAVAFLLKWDKKNIFLFDSLKENEYLGVDSVVLIYEGQTYFYSSAVLKVFWLLGGWWKIFMIFVVIPRSWRDSIYKWVARNRGKWFGRTDACLLPNEQNRDRFLFLPPK